MKITIEELKDILKSPYTIIISGAYGKSIKEFGVCIELNPEKPWSCSLSYTIKSRDVEGNQNEEWFFADDLDKAVEYFNNLPPTD